MPVTLKLTFPAGRYHATPWGRHVNEGVAEWPPSPWRLLRALVAVWKRTCPELSGEVVGGLLQKLAEAPAFQLPPHRVAHTRHYMPLNTKSPVELKGGGTTLVFDTFVAVGRESPLLVHWAGADLTADESAALKRLAGNLTSLGRAESWVEAGVSDDVLHCPCAPLSAADSPGAVAVFCPDPASAFGDEHYPPQPTAKELKRGLRADRLLFDAPRWHLCLDTETVHANRWPRVPGARWVSYSVPVSAPPAEARPNSASPVERPQVARFLLDGPVLPLAVDAVAVADAARQAAMSRFGRWCERRENSAAAKPFERADRPGEFASPVLSGKDAAGNRRTESHGHAHYLPTAERGDGRSLTHVTVYAPDGFGPEEVAGLTSIGKLSVRLGKHALVVRAQLVGLGAPANFAGVPLFGRGRAWESVTPFVAHRHLKRSGTKRDVLESTPGSDPRDAFLELAAREAARLHGVADTVARAEVVRRPGVPPAAAYRRARGPTDGYGRACGFLRLEFAVEIAGPLCLGFGSHFGLGLFTPVAALAGSQASRLRQ